MNHGITLLSDDKKTEDGTVAPLAESMKKNIPHLFSFPNYSQNLDTSGFYHLLESSKFVISGLANQGGSHGKQNPPKVKLEDVKVAVSYLIMMINTILPFEK